MRLTFAFFVVWAGLILQQPLNSGWLERKAEGWAWYEESEKQDKQKKQEPQVKEEEVQLSSSTPAPPPLSATEKAAQIRKELEEKLAQAVLEPTQEHIENYMREQQKWINQSAKFSSGWAKVLLQQPDLDATTEFPVSQYGIQLYKQLQQEKRETLMRKLIPHYGLFFFYEGTSKTSQAFALVVQDFAKKYGWEVIAISKDGYFLEGFSDNHLNNGIIQNLEVEFFPSLFLVNPQTVDVRPLAFGLVSIDQIEKNIVLHFQEVREE